MPRVTINGNAPSAPKAPAAPRAASRGAPAGQSFGDTLANAIATGQQIDPTLLANSAFSQSFQSPAGQAAANRAAQDRLIAAIQAARRGSSGAADSIARAQQGLSLLRAAGATPNVNTTAAAAALDRVMRSRASTGLVPAGGGGMDVIKYLGRIDASTKQVAKIETDAWNQARRAFGTPGGLYYRASAGGLAPVGGGRGGGWWSPGSGTWAGGGAGGGLPGIGAGGGMPPGGGGGMWPPGPGPAPGGGGQGGGGGGGGFRRARRGYGFGRAVSRIPYVGGPLANIIEAGAIGGPWAAAAAAGVEAAEFAVFNKQMIGNELSAATGRASLFRDTQIDAFALGRAGGFSGQAIMDQIYSPVSSGITGGAFKAPDLLRRYGITAQEALADVSRFGIVQQPRVGNTAIGGRGNTVIGGDPATNAGVPDGMAEAFGGAMTSNLIRALNDPKNDPAYSGMDQNTLKRQASTMAAYGFISGDAAGVNRYFDRLRPVMIDAVTTGTDQTRMAQAIVDTMVGGARRGSVGITQENVQAGLGMFSNLAGGRTGEVGMSFGQALNAGTDMVGRSPMQSVAYMQAARQYNTPAKLAQLFGGSIPDNMKPLANDYFAAHAAGNLPMAANILAGMVHDNIPLQTALAAGQLGALSGYMQATAMLPFAPGTSLAARREALDNYRAARGGGRGGVKPSLTTPQQGAAAQRMMSELMNGPLHLTAEQASGIVGNAWQESGLDPRASNNIAGGHAGLIQWDRGRQAAIAAHFHVNRFSDLTEMQQIQGLEWEMTDKPQGEQNSLAQLRRTNTSADAAVAFNRFNERSEGGGTEGDAARIEYANRARLGGSSGIPQEGYDQRATGGQAATASSEDSFRNVSWLLNALGILAKTIDETSARIRRTNGSYIGGGALGGMPAIGPGQD